MLKVDRAFLIVARLERLRSLAAQVHRLGVLDRFFGGMDPLQVPEKPLQLGPPIVLIRLKTPSPPPFAVSAPILDPRPAATDSTNASMPPQPQPQAT